MGVGSGGTPTLASVRATSADPAAPYEADPWQTLALFGAQLLSALGSAGNPAAPVHPWIERDPDGGAPSLKLPLPSPETAVKMADVLSMLANTLRGAPP
jgi:hypothetical protein